MHSITECKPQSFVQAYKTKDILHLSLANEVNMNYYVFVPSRTAPTQTLGVNRKRAWLLGSQRCSTYRARSACKPLHSQALRRLTKLSLLSIGVPLNYSAGYGTKALPLFCCTIPSDPVKSGCELCVATRLYSRFLQVSI